MDAQPQPSDSEPTDAHKALGSRLKELRLGLVGEHGKPLTQPQMAKKIYVGHKSVISLFESGKRLPTEDTLRCYAAACECDPGELIAMRSKVVSANRDQPEPVRLPDFAGRVPPESRQRWWSPKRWRLTAGITAVLVVVVVVFSLVGASSATSRVRITEPHGVMTAVMTPFHAVVTGYSHDDLWVDVQSENGDRHHPTEDPCARDGKSLSISTLYVGQPTSHGVEFRIRVVATVRGSQADKQLLAYGERPKNKPTTYLGLTELPRGSKVVASIQVKRR